MPTDNEYLRQIVNQLSASPSPSPTPTPAPSGVMIAPGENHIGEVGGNLGTSSINFARPNDSTAYAANDGVGGFVLNFTNISRINGGWGYISKAMCATNQATMPGQLRLHLFNFAAIAVVADNAPFTTSAAENGNYQGWVDFNTFITGGAGSTASRSLGQLGTLTSMPFQAQSTSRSLFGIVETLNAWTPAPQQQFSFYLTGDRY
jgi:hypothetical protein